MQMFKVFVLSRVTVKALRTLPGMMTTTVSLASLSGANPSSLTSPPGSAGAVAGLLDAAAAWTARSASIVATPSSPGMGMSRVATAGSRAGTGGTSGSGASGLGFVMPPHIQALLVPADSCIVGSNMYTVAESCLLAWASSHFAREFGVRANRLTNFDEDFKDGLALFSLLAGYWPAFCTKKQYLKTGSHLKTSDYMDNAETVVRLMADLGLPYEVSPQDIAEPNAKEMLVLLLYLFQVRTRVQVYVDIMCTYMLYVHNVVVYRGYVCRGMHMTLQFTSATACTRSTLVFARLHDAGLFRILV